MASPLNNPALLAFAGQLLQNAGGPGPGFGQALGGGLSGLANARLMQQQQAQQQQQNQLETVERGIGIQAALGQLQAQQVEAAAASDQKARLREFAGSLPPEHQKLFAADPAGYLEWYQQNQLPQQPDPITPYQQAQLAQGDQELDLKRQEFEAEQAGGGEQTAAMRLRAQKIADLMSLQDLDQADATAIIDGQVTPVVGPRGEEMLVNKATGKTTPIETPPREIEPLGDGQGGAISLDALAGEIGAVPFAKDVIAKTIGQAYPGLVDEARTKAATQLGVIQQKAIMAFSTSSRPPVIEQARIAQLFPQKGIYDSGERARQQLSHLRDLTVQTHDSYLDLVNSGSLPIDQENELVLKMAELRQLNKMLPEQAALPTQGANQSPPGGQPQASSPRAPRKQTPNQEAKTMDRAKKLGFKWSDVMETAKIHGHTPEQVLDNLARGGGG